MDKTPTPEQVAKPKAHKFTDEQLKKMTLITVIATLPALILSFIFYLYNLPASGTGGIMASLAATVQNAISPAAYPYVLIAGGITGTLAILMWVRLYKAAS